MIKLKQSGIDWIGDIPANWSLNKIGAVYEERNTKVSDKDYEPLSVTKQGVVPQLDNAAKTDNGDNRKLICKNDFVINSRSDRRGSCGISDRDGSCSLINTVLKPRKNMCNRYYSFVFKSDNFADEYYRWGHGIVDDLWSTKWMDMKNIYIPSPSLEEQERIADYLELKCKAIEETLELQEKTIGKLKEFKQSFITEIVSKGLNKKAIYKESGFFWIGSVPNHWEVGQLKYFASIRAGITLGKTYSDDEKLVEMPYLRVANVQGEYVDFSDIATLRVREDEIEKYRLHAGELLMTEGGDRDKLGRGTVWNNEIDPCLHQNHVFALTTDDARLDVHYLDYVTTSKIGRNYFDYTAKKTTNLASTNSTAIMQFRIPIPPIEEQHEIVRYLDKKVDDINRTISIREVIISKLNEYKKSLIYEVVTGKKEV